MQGCPCQSSAQQRPDCEFAAHARLRTLSGGFHVKRTVIPALLIVALAALELGCGDPAIGKLRSVSLSASPTTNLKGEGATTQLFATGNYSTGSQQDLTNRVTYNITPTGTDDGGNPLPNPVSASCGPAQGCGDISVSPTGLVTAVQPFVCTWVNTNTSGTGTATWALSGSYEATATVNGITSQPVFISLASAAGASGACGP
jgi:hypothetical protein